MKATHEDLSGLIRLQQTDLDALKQKKALDELPQRKTILNARQKRAVIEEKLARVAELRKEAESRLTRIEVEDGSLEEKADGVQAAIAEAQGDYRNVEARTKELDGIAKRRETLEEDRARAKADLAKIGDVDTQVALTLEEISKSENAAVESFKKEGGALGSACGGPRGHRGGNVARDRHALREDRRPRGRRGGRSSDREPLRRLPHAHRRRASDRSEGAGAARGMSFVQAVAPHRLRRCDGMTARKRGDWRVKPGVEAVQRPAFIGEAGFRGHEVWLHLKYRRALVSCFDGFEVT